MVHIQLEAIALSKKCRAGGNTAFFWSSSFALDGCFFADLGSQYSYTDENKKVEMHASYPTLCVALAMKMNKLISKKMYVSLTYLKFRSFETHRFVLIIMQADVKKIHTMTDWTYICI